MPVKVEDDIAACAVSHIQNSNLSGRGESYKLLAISPMHENEYKNLRDKIDEAYHDMIGQ